MQTQTSRSFAAKTHSELAHVKGDCDNAGLSYILKLSVIDASLQAKSKCNFAGIVMQI